MLNKLYGKDVRKEPEFSLKTRWLETVDTKAAVRAYMRKLFDLAEQGILQKIPEESQASTPRILQLPKRDLQPIFNDKIAALKAKKKNKPTP